jgi:hypothetical protein
MTLGKSLALAMGFVVAMALGVWIGPHLTDRAWFDRDHKTAAHDVAPEASKPHAAARPTAPAARESAPREIAPAVALSTPELQARLKPVLNRLKPVLNKGTNMTIAADGFRSAEEFATVAHAARNTDVPFMVLKHRVLTEGKSLAKAIRESKPELNANAEVRRARAEARSDLNDLAS